MNDMMKDMLDSFNKQVKSVDINELKEGSKMPKKTLKINNKESNRKNWLDPEGE